MLIFPSITGQTVCSLMTEPVITIFVNPTSLLRHPKSLDVLVKEINALDWYNARREGFGDLYEGLF